VTASQDLTDEKKEESIGKTEELIEETEKATGMGPMVERLPCDVLGV
jgi:hypothetical protein